MFQRTGTSTAVKADATDTDLERLAREELDRLRERFICSPIREVEFVEQPQNRELVGGLVQRRVVLNRAFLEQFVRERKVKPRAVLRAALARSLNRYIRVPESFAQSLRLFAAIRAKGFDPITARRFLEVYFALWCECDLFERRGLKDELIRLYRASLTLPREELKKLETHYLILVAVLEQRWGVKLGLPQWALRGWKPLARDLASIDYLDSPNRERDVKEFAWHFSKCCQIISDRTAQSDLDLKAAQEKQKEEPIHWPLESTIESFTTACDIAKGIAELFEELGAEAALQLLAEFTQDHPGFLQQLGVRALLDGSRWLYYKELAEKYRLKVELKPLQETGRAYPVSLKEFELGDPWLLVALQQSFGRPATPGITKCWVLSGPQSQLERLESPDLLIIIDSSGSMPNPNGMSYAVLGGFVAVNAYLDRGARVAVLNFSTQDITLDFTTRREEVYKHLAAWQGGGTTLRPEAIDRLLTKAQGREVDILLISDLDIHNASEAVAGLARHARTHRLFVFLIQGSSNEAKVKEMQEKLPEDVEFHVVQNEESLVDLVLGAARRSQEAFAGAGKRA